MSTKRHLAAAGAITALTVGTPAAAANPDMDEELIFDEAKAATVTAGQDAFTPVSDDSEPMDDLLELSLEELLAEEVTSVAKKARRVGDSAAAVTVISQEDIRRSSARTIPDLLRMVPGMEIAELQTSSTSVSARGFTSRFAANLLVMVDGASIYSTSISGMFWDMSLVPLQDIERIEVIRGPGGSIWGSNATSGIVNIITKQSIDTQGVRANVSVGTFDDRAEISFGQQLGDDLSYRAYGVYRQTDGYYRADGTDRGESWKGGLVGARIDYAPSAADNIVVLAEYSEGRFTDLYTPASTTSLIPEVVDTFTMNRFLGNHVLARWNHKVNPDLNFSVQGYYNRLLRTEFELEIHRDLYDLSFEGRWRANATHEFNFGVAGRISKDELGDSFSLTFRSDSSTDRWLTGYLQDDIQIIQDKLRLTLGSKFELNNFTGTELQPSARLFYRHSPAFAAWASVTRAVRTPLLVQREGLGRIDSVDSLPGFPMPALLSRRFDGDPTIEAENITSYEAGVRGELGGGWSYDVAGSYARFTDVISLGVVGQGPFFLPGNPIPVGVRVDSIFGNFEMVDSYAVETSVAGPLSDWWNIEASYSFLSLTGEVDPGRASLAPVSYSPKHQLRLASNMRLAEAVTLDADVHHVSVAIDGARPAYTDLDLRLSYRFNANVAVAIVGSNLLKKRRIEYIRSGLPISDLSVPRMAHLETSFRF